MACLEIKRFLVFEDAVGCVFLGLDDVLEFGLQVVHSVAFYAFRFCSDAYCLGLCKSYDIVPTTVVIPYLSSLNGIPYRQD